MLTQYENRGIQQGLQQGIQQGLQQGIQQGMQRSLLRLLESRFGILSPEIVVAVEAITDTKRLEELLLQVMEAQTLADVGLTASEGI